MRHRVVALALSALCLAVPVAAQAPKLTAHAERTEVGVGEPFAVEIKVEAPAGTTWTFPAEAGDDRVELWAKSADPAGPAEKAPVHRYEAMAVALQDVAVPVIRARYRLPDGSQGEAATEPIPLRIVSVLPKDPSEQKLADIHGPLPLPIGRPFWLALGAAALLLGAGILWLLRSRRRRQPLSAGEPELPPHAQAARALDALVASGRLARGELRAFYIELAEIAKRYLERRLDAPVLEMTSAEMVAFLRDNIHAHALAPAMRDLAFAADQVKFARGSGEAQEAERHLAAVRAAIDALEARLAPKPADAKVA
jgi:hypothetical protein